MVTVIFQLKLFGTKIIQKGTGESLRFALSDPVACFSKLKLTRMIWHQNWFCCTCKRL